MIIKYAIIQFVCEGLAYGDFDKILFDDLMFSFWLATDGYPQVVR